MTYFQREAMIWNQLQHQNIVPLIAFIPSYKSSVFPALISEYFENGDIRKYLRMKRPVTIRKKYELLLDVLRGLEYLHGSLDPATGKRFVHRDIKGGNILVNNDERALITDFGNAKFIGDDSNFISSLRYSLNWTPPEYLIDPQKFHHGYRTFGDMWSYGCTVIEVLLEKDPWEDLKEDVEDTIKYGILTQPEALQDAQYDGCWPLIAQCITKEPTNRITATTAIAIIQSMMGANETR
ncbi:kinase-like protein [Rickenella mellea]|uniref:Kinase-like protein n=1 Tax=Rickenella mellea TaxID=50990 RepID=A0A4Y7PW58_9AGAM|nr:kinase-like protein [Rickenella mellea]